MHAPALSVKKPALTHAGRQLVHQLTFSGQAGECVTLLEASGPGKFLTVAAVGTVPGGITASGEVSLAGGSAEAPFGPFVGTAARSNTFRRTLREAWTLE